MSTAGKAVFLSALTSCMALAAVFLVPVMVFRSMALGMILSVVAVAFASLTLLPALLVALGDRVLVQEERRGSPTSPPSRRWQRWTGVVAAPARHACSRSGSSLLGGLIAPAFGMHLGMPGARVVDKGHTSRDGYDMLVAAFGPGAAAPAFITTPAADATAVVTRVASGVPGVVDARVVTPPASDRPRRRARHRLDARRRPRTGDDGRHGCRSRLHDRRARRAGRRPRRAEP